MLNNHQQVYESYQQHQQMAYAEGTDTAHRESFLRSLAQNPNMLDDFHRFLEYTRGRSEPMVEQSVQDSQRQRVIPSIMYAKEGTHATSSTPKRGRPLNDSRESTSAVHKQHKSNSYSEPVQGQAGSMTASQQQRKPLPFEQLKRAVSSNLPCFYVEFDQSAGAQQPPSAFAVRNSIEKHFQEHNVRIRQFTLVGWTNKRLKLGVNNKEDYSILATTDKWPTTINNIDIKIIKPKFIPDCFTLVVRYVPRDIEIELVTEEIKRTIASADNVKKIHYGYERKTNDFRFSVTDLREYNAALDLGRISIGNRWVSITQFLAGNRMTYCTRCWQIGHLRGQCQAITQKCRLCLDEFVGKDEHRCSNQPKCAQCGDNHHSLDSRCNIIQRYRSDLKEDVTHALENGRLHRSKPVKQQENFNLNNQDFPPLCGSELPRRAPWQRALQEQEISESPDTTKSLLLINENLIAMRESSKRVEDKLERIDSKLNQTALDTQLHQDTLMKLIENVKALVEHIIWPLTAKSHPHLLNSPTGLQVCFDKLQALKTNLHNDFEVRRKRAPSPLPPRTTLSTTIAVNDNSSDSNMNEP